MKAAAGALALLAVFTARHAGADEKRAEQLDAFIVDACEYLSQDDNATAEQAQAHFGKLRRREWVTKQVGTPHARFHLSATRLPGWEVSLENHFDLNVAVPKTVRITVGELEKLVGDAHSDDSDPIPSQFVIERLGPRKVCSVNIVADGKSGADDWKRQLIRSLRIVC